jgi:hypothetical protein
MESDTLVPLLLCISQHVASLSCTSVEHQYTFAFRTVPFGTMESRLTTSPDQLDKA